MLITLNLHPVLPPARSLPNSNRGRTIAVITLSRYDLVFKRPKLQAALSPSSEVVGDVDATAGALVAANGIVLEECASIDRQLGVADGLAEAVFTPVYRIRRELLLGIRGWVEGAEGLDDVVLDLRVGHPAVDGQVRVPHDVEGCIEVDSP